MLHPSWGGTLMLHPSWGGTTELRLGGLGAAVGRRIGARWPG